MARTCNKATMDDLSLFSTSTALEELEFIHPFTVTEGVFLDDYDTLNGELDGNSKLPSAGELFEELDLEAHDDFLGSSWMTEKIDFTAPELILPLDDEPSGSMDVVNGSYTSVEQAPDLPQVTPDTQETPASVEQEPEGNIFANVEEILRRLCANKVVQSSVEQTSCPLSPSQSVPTTIEVLSPQSEVSDESQSVASPYSDEDSPSSPSSPEPQAHRNSSKMSPSKETRAVRFSPYTKERPQYSPTKSKTPRQRERKREQNKDAATRYRIKKRDEADAVKKELLGLEKDNVELKQQVTSLLKEIEYLKNLMLEVYKTKLLKQSSINLPS